MREVNQVAAVLHESEARIYYLQEQPDGMGLINGSIRGREEAPHEAICRVLAEQTTLEGVTPELFEDPFNPAARVYTVDRVPSLLSRKAKHKTYIYDLLVARNAQVELKEGRLVQLKEKEIAEAITLGGLTEVASNFFQRYLR